MVTRPDVLPEIQSVSRQGFHEMLTLRVNST